MPKIHEIREVKFVGPEWTGDERGYAWIEVSEYAVVEYYKEYFENALVRARDQARLCAELGHDHPDGGCGAPREGGERQCAFMVRRIETIRFSPERQRLVRITIPVA